MSLALFYPLIFHFVFNVLVFLTTLGAIAVTGGLFSNASVPVVIDSIECTGSERALLNCSYVTDSNETVRECDPEEIAAVTCQGKFCVHLLCSELIPLSMCVLYTLIEFLVTLQILQLSMPTVHWEM